MPRTVIRTRRRRAAVAMVAAAAAVAGAATYLQSRGSSGVKLPTTYGSIHMVASLEGGHKHIGQPQIQIIAKHDSVVIAQPRRMRRIAQPLKAINPSIVLTVYENGMYSTTSDPQNLPSSWYLRDSAGNLVHPRLHPANSLMNPLSTAPYSFQGHTYHGWASYVAGRCAGDQLPQTSGCYIDMLGISALNPGWNQNRVVPVDPRTHRPFTPTVFEHGDLQVAAAVWRALPSGKIVLADGYSDAPQYEKASHALNGQVTGGEAQTWLSRNAQNLTPAEWAANVQMIISSGQTSSSMMVRYWCNCTGSAVSTQRVYGLATYLLANTGRAFFDFEHGSTKEFEDWSPLYDLNLGHPLQTASSASGYFRGGVYQRAYSGGLVMVNPGQSQVTVRLSKTYKDLSGNQVRSVTLAPRSASILTT